MELSLPCRRSAALGGIDETIGSFLGKCRELLTACRTGSERGGISSVQAHGGSVAGTRIGAGLARWRNSFGCADEWKSGRKPDVPVTRDNTLRRSRLFASDVDVRCGSKPVLTAPKRDFRSSNNGHHKSGTVGPFGAFPDLRNAAKGAHSITSSASNASSSAPRCGAPSRSSC